MPIPTHVGEEQLWLSLGLKSQWFFVLQPRRFHQFRQRNWFFAVHLECISRWVALVLDEHQIITFLCPFLFLSKPRKGPSNFHLQQTFDRKKSARENALSKTHRKPIWCNKSAQKIIESIFLRVALRLSLSILWKARFLHCSRVFPREKASWHHLSVGEGMTLCVRESL